MTRTTVIICGFLMLTAPLAHADTFVRLNTCMGDIDFQLYDDLAPLTVANFLNYVGDGDYDNSFIHRSVPGFVIQGGGHTYAGVVPEDPAIINEFNPATMANTVGTVAMARGGTLDSATSQWFINLADNDMLDNPANPYCVFARVVGGMDVVEEIAALPVEDMSIVDPAYNELPMINYTVADPFNPVTEDNLVMVYSVAAFQPLPGDANLDEYVDQIDYMAWSTGYEPGAGGKFWDNGDFTGDKTTDGLDYIAWSNNFLQGSAPTGGTGAAVPEPASALVLALGLFFVRRRRRA